MAYATDTRTLGTPTFGQRVSAVRATLADRAAKNKVYRTTMVELGALSDRDLADLGIARSMIKGIAYEAAYK
ncbi:DUF1127 domain-containing protein [Pseudoroseicyclus aestuarii]|uniref:Uncharacterized protein DUF1127 n=1 Tax=Pseudoroseicyclus aestuarii TaxID=1795041 RepID=A0A318SPH3_9RHOB|nr:DUF1127 domain-containing protein [Pseudoroseicyclus aestuarii]PYE82536.1 uncharacterized protein DUF1127 [Pseudoroseicyclus aestuarii]